jgi:arginase
MRIGLLGAPTSVGSHHAGQENAPDAVRAAGIVDLLTAGGHQVRDHGNLTRRPHRAEPAVNGARAASAVAETLTELSAAVGAIVDAGEVPLVVGGDCTITLGVLAGVARQHPHLIYIDGDADLSTPRTSDTGVLDSMGIAHLLGQGAPELAPVVRAAGLAAADITLYGTNPAELGERDRTVIQETGLRLIEVADVLPGPDAAARLALERIPPGTPLVIHLDVDVLDSGDLPLANFPHFGGLSLEALEASLRVFAGRPPAALTLTEINPSYDPTGAAVRRVVRCLAAALAVPQGRDVVKEPI